MIGDVPDMVGRLRSVLPTRWFADVAPLRDGLLGGLGTAWSAVHGLILAVRGQARIATASGSILDLAAFDFFGSALLRRNGESDASLQARVKLEMLRPRATRGALSLALSDLTGRAPSIFEPARPADTGGYTVGGTGYGVAGGWGNLGLPFQVFVTAYRPRGGGIASVAGYGTGGELAYGSLDMVLSDVSDADIAAVTAANLPVATTAWLAIAG